MNTIVDRLMQRTEEFGLIQDLNTRYNLSLAAAEKLTEELTERYFCSNDRLNDGEQWYTAVDISEPAGKLLKDCKKRRIRLTVNCLQDLEIENERGLAYVRFEKVARLAWEAYNQNALLTQEEIGRILNMSPSGIKKIVGKHRKEGNLLPTRGNYHDIGPGVSHKYEAVKLFLRGMTLSDIAYRMHHSLWSIERYIKDFCTVFMAHCEGYTPERIAHMTKLSLKLVKEYISLYHQFCNCDNREFLKLIEIRLGSMIDFKKTVEGA
jgi:DNA-binding CsgD family transcriptional regulator